MRRGPGGPAVAGRDWHARGRGDRRRAAHVRAARGGGDRVSEAVRVERDGPVYTVLLSRPERRNAVDGPTAAALVAAFREFDADPEAAVAVLHGEGGVFCAGADLKAVGSATGNQVVRDG